MAEVGRVGLNNPGSEGVRQVGRDESEQVTHGSQVGASPAPRSFAWKPQRFCLFGLHLSLCARLRPCVTLIGVTGGHTRHGCSVTPGDICSPTDEGALFDFCYSSVPAQGA